MGASMISVRSRASSRVEAFGFVRWFLGLVVLLLALVVAAAVPAQETGTNDPADPWVRLIGTSGIKREDPRFRVAELFLQVRDGKIGGAEFFAGLASADVGMKEVREVRTAIQKAGVSDHFLGKKFGGGGTPVEMAVLEHRRRVTERLILETVRSSPVNSSVFVAKVGKWASQAAEALTFDGDIDFSFIAADMRDAKRLKDDFDARLRKELGLAAEARGADVVATTHGMGDAEVYTGDAGQGFAEQALDEVEAKARKDGKPLVWIEAVTETGSLQPSDMVKLRAAVSLERGLVTERAARLPDIRVPSDPGLSMEMVRHLLHDIKGSKEYPPGVLIVKASKYLQRSDQSASEGGIKATNALSAGADEIVTLSKDPDAGKLRRHLSDKFGSGGVIAASASDKYVDSVERGIWRNVELSIHAKADGLEKRAAEAERATGEEREKLLDALKADTLQLHDTIAAERGMLSEAHVEMPATIEAQIGRVTKIVEKLKKLGRPITDNEMRQKRFVEELVKSGKPTAFAMARAAIFDFADKALEKGNEKLDFIDDYLFSELRGDRDFDALLKEVAITSKILHSTDPRSRENAGARLDALRQQVKLGIAETNRRLNETIQRSAVGRGAMKGLMVFGLAEEIPVYVDALWTGDYNGFVMEFFRHRMPLFSSTERVVVDGNPSDYVMAAWDVVVTLVPPIGLGQAAVGIAADLGKTGYGLYWDDKLQVFVDEVYAGARFKPTAKVREGDAWFADWRLVGVTYRGEFHDLKAFAEMRREDIKAMAAELKKPRKARDLNKPLFGHETGLIDNAAVDRTLRHTLAASDPQLRFLEELGDHPQAGPALLGQYGDQKRVRWEEVKLAFLVELVDRMETRWARDWAAKSGQLPALQAELGRITRQLEIADEVKAVLDAAKPGKLSLMTAWLHARERDLFLQPDAVGVVEEEVGRVQEALTAYRAILETRGVLETRLGTVEVRDGGLRLLTGPPQLRGTPAVDRRFASQWPDIVERLSTRAADELRGVKVKLIGGSIDQTVLDPGFDQGILKQVSVVDVWRYAWAQIQAAGEGAKRPGTLDDPQTAFERLKGARVGLIEEFAAHYRGAGVLEATIVDSATGTGLEGANATLGAATATSDRQGKVIFTGLQPGRYDLSATAAEHEAGKVGDLVYPVPSNEGVGNRRVVKLALVPSKEEPRRSGLTVGVTDAADGKALAGATVTIIGSADRRPVVLTTGGDGRVRFDDLAPGNWLAAAQAVDHKPGRVGPFALPVGKTGPSRAAVTIALERVVPPKTDDTAEPTDKDGTAAPLTGADETAATDKVAEGKVGPNGDDQQRKNVPPETPKTNDKQSDGDKNKPPAVTPIALPRADMNTWLDAMFSREEYLKIAARTDLAPADREKVKGVIATLEAREKVLWDAAAAELAEAESYLGRIRAEVVKAYATFRARAPKPYTPQPSTSSPSASGVTISGLDGEAIGTVPCLAYLTEDETRDLADIDDQIARARAARARFGSFSPERPAYSAAMEGWSNLTVDHDKEGWKKTGWKRRIFDRCDGPSIEASLPPATVASAAKADAVELGLAARLVFDAKTLGRPEVDVVADGVNGIGPYKFEFPGAVRVTGARATFAMPATKGMGAKASVRVTDAKGRVATAELPLEPLAITVTLRRSDAAAATPVPVGGTASFEATLVADGKPVDPKGWVLRWEPSTDVRFKNFEGAGVVANTATFPRPGHVKVWVVALQKQGGALATVGESGQIDIEVVAPGLTLKVEPEQPLIGDTVTVRARDLPASKDADVAFRWSMAGEAEAAGPTADQRVYTFIAKSAKPVTVSVQTVGRAKGDALASANATVTPRPRKVTATNRGPAFGPETTKIVLWKQGVGLVRLEREIAAFMDVTLAATIDPVPKDPVRWAWSVNEGSSLSGNPASAETRAQRATAGTIEATVVARDGRGIELGRGTVSVAVTVSDEAVRQGRDKAKALDDAKARGTRAWAAGDVEAACAAGEEARAIQPDVTEVRTWCDGRDRIRTLAAEAEKAIAPPPTAAGVARAVEALRGIEVVNAKAGVLAQLKQKVEAARSAAKTNETLEADRKARLATLLAGAQACGAQKWKECRETIDKGLAGDDKVFHPEDGKLVEKAKALRATAEAAEKKAADAAASAEADRKARLAALLAGAQACGAQKWKECREAIDKGLAGGDKVFHPEDGKLVEKAKALKATAEAAEKKAADAAAKHLADEKKKAAEDAAKRQEAEKTAAEDAAKRREAEKKAAEDARKQPKEGAAANDAERQRRIFGLKAGIATCEAKMWTACRETIEANLEGGDAVFRPEDTELVAKARALAASAAAAETGQAVPQSAAPVDGKAAATSDGAPEGLWDTTIPGSVHVQLDIRRVGGGWSIRFFGFKGWEEMADVVVDPTRGTFSFRRPLKQWGENDQTYSGTVAGGVMNGAFNGSVAWQGQRAKGGSQRTETAPPATPPTPPAPPTASAATRDGVYRAIAEGYFARPQTSFVFTVNGGRIVLSREATGTATFEGQIAANGDFVIVFSNNRWTGRVADGRIEGKWAMAKGILNDRPTSGPFHATRQGQ